MVIRKYRDYGTIGSAREIINECITKGCSKGWAGGEEMNEVEKICNQFNVFYVCDFNGEWAVRVEE